MLNFVKIGGSGAPAAIARVWGLVMLLLGLAGGALNSKAQPVTGEFQFSSSKYVYADGDGAATITVVRLGGATGKVLVDWTVSTNIFAVTNAAATNWTEVSGTLEFVDYQMSTNFTFGFQGVHSGLRRVPVTNIVDGSVTTNFIFTEFAVGLKLSNPRIAPEEDQSLPTPGIRRANADLIMQDNSDGFNFDQSRYLVGEIGNDYNPETRISYRTVWVVRSQPYNEGVSVDYRINFPGDAYNSFPLEPGSDYANASTDFDHGADYIPVTGTLTWAPFDLTLHSFRIPIINDNEVEFNEDMYLELFNPSQNAFLGHQFYSTLTILADDFYYETPTGSQDDVSEGFILGEQPAGAVDRYWNRDNEVAEHVDPPFNPIPGANNTVRAVVPQADGKLLVGGDFQALNTVVLNRVGRFNFDGSIDHSFNPGTAADGSISSIIAQPDGKIIVGGSFTSFNGTDRYGIARLQTNGLLDTTFKLGLGVRGGSVKAMALTAEGKVLIGGDFTSINGTNRNYLARLNSDGSLDTTFDTGKGPDGPVNAIAVDASPIFIDRQAEGGPAEDRFEADTGATSGVINIRYNFYFIPDSMRIYYEGNLIYDSGFVNGARSISVNYGPGVGTKIEVVMNEGSGLFGTVWDYSLDISPDADQRPIIGGNFTTVNGTNRNYIARLNLNGSLDTSFNPGTGADGPVYALVKQGNKAVMGGAFSSVDERSRNGLARLNVDGSLDSDFQITTGANDTVYTLGVQRTGRILVGGVFTAINDTRRVGFARLNINGSLDTTFMDTAYNQFAGIPNWLSTDPQNFVLSIASYPFKHFFQTNIVSIDANNVLTTNSVTTNIITEQVFIGGKFKKVGGGFLRDVVRTRYNVARIIGDSTPGPGNVEFIKPNYTVDEDAGYLFVKLRRLNGELGPVTAEMATQEPPQGSGVATAGADYVESVSLATWDSTWGGLSSTRMKSDAVQGVSNNEYSRIGTGAADTSADDVYVRILDDKLLEGDENLNLKLSIPTSFLDLGGMAIPLLASGGLMNSTLTVVDNDYNRGLLGFDTPTFTVNEDGKTATITVTRLNGAVGDVGIDYATISGGTATVRDDYALTTGTLSFASGQTSKTFTIPIVDDTKAELDETVKLVLRNPTGFPANVEGLDSARASSTLTIIDNDFAPGRISFEKATFSVDENGGSATVNVVRTGGSLGEIFVDFSTSDGTAVSPQDYAATTQRLHFVSGDTTPKTITIPLFDNQVVAADKTVKLTLSNPSVTGALGVQPVATLKIVNDDQYGTFVFSQPVYSVDEVAPYANITVLRTSGLAGTISVDYAVTSRPNEQVSGFVPTSGTLTFLPNETSKTFSVIIKNDSVVTGDRAALLLLSNPVLGGLPVNSGSTLTIVDDELHHEPAGALDTSYQALGTDQIIYSLLLQPDGSLLMGGDFDYINDVVRHHMARLLPSGFLDRTFDPSEGFNNSVRTMALQNDGRIVVGGLFSSVNSTNRNFITRINFDGAVDPTFNPGSGADNPVYAVAMQSDNKILIGGAFSSFNGIGRHGLARLATNGLIDLSFDIGTGADSTIYAVAVQADGKILVGGDFTTFNGKSRMHLARLNRDGSVDESFPDVQADGSVRAITIQSDRQILVGGIFESIAGKNWRSMARLNWQDGTPDASFTTGVGATAGANGPVNAIAVQIDGKIILGGGFTRYAGVTRNRITRLNSDGSIDPTINFGTGADSTVETLALQTDRAIVLAGDFTSFNGVPKRRLARIHGGGIDGPGAVEFVKPFFSVNENETNAVVYLRRIGGTTGEISVTAATADQTAKAGFDYTAVTTQLVFPSGENFASFLIPIRQDSEIELVETFNVGLGAVKGGAVLGPQPNTTVSILSDDSRISFTTDAYTVTENFVTGSASITVTRVGSTLSAASVDFLTTTNGTATAGADYKATALNLNFQPGETSKTFEVPVINDALVEGNETVLMVLTNLVGASVTLGPITNSVLTIVDDDFAPGVVGFSAPLYTVKEGDDGEIRFSTITVKRTAGTTGVISVEYATSKGTATPTEDYKDVSGILAFSDGETEKTFNIPILGDVLVEGNETINISLSNPKGGTTIVGPATVVLTIQDDDLGPGSLDTSFQIGKGADGSVNALKLLANGQILIAGDFTHFNDTNRVRVARLSDSGALDLSLDPAAGPNNSVLALATQADDRIVVAGAFNTESGLIRNRVARLLPSGALDSFNLPLGLNAQVSDIAIQPTDGKIVIGGAFVEASAAGRSHIARLNPDGTLDLSFDPGVGADNNVTAVALQPDGKILIGGSFSTINKVNRKGIARLNKDGSVDLSFVVGTGANGSVQDILLLDSGKMLIAGDFTAYNGSTRVRVARLNADGSLDTSFDPGAGPDKVVNALAIQPDGKVFIAGDFGSVSGVVRVRVARLTDTGSFDDTFNPGDGPNDAVYEVVVQPTDGKVLIAGRFTTVDRADRRGVARLNNDKSLVPRSVKIASITRVSPGGDVRFTFDSQPGLKYQVESSSDLLTWSPVATVVASGSSSQFSEAPSSAAKFYRLRILLQ